MNGENDDGGIFDIQHDTNLELKKTVEMARKYGPTVEDMKITLEDKKHAYEIMYRSSMTDEETTRFITLRREVKELEDFLSDYDTMTPEQRKHMNNSLSELLKNSEDQDL